MIKFEELLRKFNENLVDEKLDYVNNLVKDFFDELLHHIHCEGATIEIVEDDENYLYKSSKNHFIINIKIINHFQKFAHLFLLDTLFIIARRLMQTNFSNILKERENNNGQFFVVNDNCQLPLNFAELFKLENIMLMYSKLEKTKDSFFSVSLFDRRAFAYACMENFISLVGYEKGKDYLKYLREDFVLCEEDARPLGVEELEDGIVSKYKSENQLGFLEELELREQIFKQIENVLGE